MSTPPVYPIANPSEEQKKAFAAIIKAAKSRQRLFVAWVNVCGHSIEITKPKDMPIRMVVHATQTSDNDYLDPGAPNCEYESPTFTSDYAYPLMLTLSMLTNSNTTQ